MTDIDDVISFWMAPEPTTAAEVQAKSAFWFRSNDELDRQIRDRFGGLVERARRGELDAWAGTPRGALALLILIDQFSRNIYRGSPDAFSADDKALGIARAGYDSGLFDGLSTVERLFTVLPFQHAEDVECQKRAVMLAVEAALSGEAYLRDFLVHTVDFARKHLDVVARFGRFPHRNAVLGRNSTAEELRYLEYLKLAGQWL
jgi:uncharacterized protein (DUF924 family)